MNSSLFNVLAAAATAQAPPAWLQFLPIVGMVVIFWFLLILARRCASRSSTAEDRRRSRRATRWSPPAGCSARCIKVDDHYAEIEMRPGRQGQGGQVDHRRHRAARRHAGQRLIGEAR